MINFRVKKFLYSLAFISIAAGCKSSRESVQFNDQQIKVSMDLVAVENDRVLVTVDPGRFNSPTTTFYIPKTVPGTYSIDNYGKFIEDLKAFDYTGKEMSVNQNGDNSWNFSNAAELDKITYYVNDSFDVEGEEGIFSPAGTNILAGKNFLLNLHGFIGYFENMEELPYNLTITRPANLVAGTSMPLSGSREISGKEAINDIYNGSRYFDIIDNPIMYAAPDTTHINLQDMKVLLQVYSPNNIYTSKSIRPEVEKMIQAQKNFLGEINNTSNYAILLYLADMETVDAKGFGALEHHTSTVVVLPETMPLESLNKTMTDVVSHEFFHILTPLNVHSNEIHYFDYNNPKMSQHLWMYEGVTEYFAHLFQVNQGLINDEEFYDRISSKIGSSMSFDDTVPFTVMSQNILEEPYKSDYYNVYLKGALIGLALDIRLRELSDGKSGILDMMKDLSERYGKDRPFEDEELIPQIVEITYPQIADFFDQHVTGETPIPYDQYLEKVGLEIAGDTIPTTYFIKGQTPYIDGNPNTGELFFRENIGLNTGLTDLGIQNGDIIKSVNGTEYTIQNVYDLIMQSQSWKEGDDLTLAVERDGEELELKGKVTQPTDIEMKIREMNLPESDPRVARREIWLRK